MPIIFNIPAYHTEKLTFVNEPDDAFAHGQKASDALNLSGVVTPGMKYILELTPPPYPLPVAFFNGFFARTIKLHGPEIIESFSARCMETKISHKREYGLDAFKKVVYFATPTQSVRSSDD